MRSIPKDWMPAAPMVRIIMHWTGGAYEPNHVDRRSYHFLRTGSGRLVRGNAKIGDRIAHTRNLNSGSIGYSLCCMGGAKEHPFNPGFAPMLRAQWDAMIDDIVTLARRYGISVTPETILSHAEVEATLGVKQNNKWDFTRLAFDPSIKGARAIGDRMRAEVARRIGRADPKYAGDLARSRTVMGAGMTGAGAGGPSAFDQLAGVVEPLSHYSQTAQWIFAGLTAIGVATVAYARWDDAGRPLPGFIERRLRPEVKDDSESVGEDARRKVDRGGGRRPPARGRKRGLDGPGMAVRRRKPQGGKRTKGRGDRVAAQSR